MAAPGDLVRYTLVHLSGDTFVVHSEAGDGQRLLAAIAHYQSGLPGVDQPGAPFPPCLMQLHDEATFEPIPMDAQLGDSVRFGFTIEAARNYAPTVNTLHVLPNTKKPGWFYYNPVETIDFVRRFLRELHERWFLSHEAFGRPHPAGFFDALFGTAPCNITAKWLGSFLQAIIPAAAAIAEAAGRGGNYNETPAHTLALVLAVILRRFRRGGALDLGNDQTRRILVAIGGGPPCRAGWRPPYRTLLLVAML